MQIAWLDKAEVFTNCLQELEQEQQWILGTGEDTLLEPLHQRVQALSCEIGSLTWPATSAYRKFYGRLREVLGVEVSHLDTKRYDGICNTLLEFSRPITLRCRALEEQIVAVREPLIDARSPLRPWTIDGKDYLLPGIDPGPQRK